jgi:hypothetical protein
MYFKIPKDTDMTNIHVSFLEELDGYLYIGLNEGKVQDDWEEIEYVDFIALFPEDFSEEPIQEPTQLDLIQQAVEKSNEELRQEGADTAILELIKKGIL